MSEETNEKTFAYYLAKAQEAREQMKLGGMALKSDYDEFGIMDRVKAKARHFGIGGTGDYGSAYSINEQQALARGDRVGSGILAASNFGFGLMNFGVGMIGGGPLAKLGGYAAMGQFVPGLAGVSGMVSNAAFYSNPASLAAMAGLSVMEKGIGENFLNPFTYARQFSGTALRESRNFIQGIGSETGVGGLSLGQSMTIGKSTERYRHMFREIEPEQFDNFLKVGQTFAPFGDSKKVGETMGKFLSVMVGLVQQFKGKEHELGQAMQQFAGMGFSVDQAAQSIRTSSRMGTMMNIDPSRIMAAGVGMTQSVAGTGISQYAAYNIGANAFTQVSQMAQLGQFSKTQLFNSGGPEGIAQTIASGQMGLLNSKYADIYLKSVYNRPGQSGTIADPNMIAKVTGGDMTMREAQFRSQATTLSPHSNMAFQFDRDSIISAMGSDAGEFADEMFSAALKRNPYANSPYGKAKLYMTMNPGVSHQQAMQYVQYHSSKNPMYTQALEEMSMDKRMAATDPFFSSNSQFARGASYIGRDLKHAWDVLARDVNPFNTDTSKGRETWGMIGDMSMLGAGKAIYNWFTDDVSQTRPIEDFSQPFKGLRVKDVMEMRKGYKPLSETEKLNKKLGNLSTRSDYLDLTEADQDFAREIVGSVGNTKGLFGSERIDDAAALDAKVNEITAQIMKNNPRYKGNFITDMGTKRSVEEFIKAQVVEQYGSTELKGKIKTSILDSGSKLDLAGNLGWYDKTTGNIFTKTKDRLSDFDTKWNASGLDERKKMVERLKEISTAEGDTDDLLTEDRALLGADRLSKDQIDRILKDETVSGISNVSDEDIKRHKYQRGVETLFSTNAYKSTFKAFGNENLGAGIAKELFLGKGAGEGDLKITEENFKKLKKSHLPGYEDIKGYLSYDKESGTVDVDSEGLMKTKGGKEKLQKFMDRHGATGEAFERINKSAEDIWRENRMNQASTIQDFAVAVATGIRMAEYAGLDKGDKKDLLGNSGNDGSNDKIWNQTTQ
jgi:hypothetical protein